MKFKALRDSLSTAKGRKTLVFLAIQSVYSLMIALLTASADPLFLNHRPDGVERFIYQSIMGGLAKDSGRINRELSALLFFVGALILVLGGLFYTGRTDRGKKWRKSLGVFALSALLSLLVWLGLSLESPPPLFYSMVYLWRFIAGIFYLMIFWDTASIYFEIRRSKRVFPQLALWGTLCYSAGSLLGASSWFINQPKRTMILLFLLSLSGMALTFLLSRKFRGVSASRYRKTTMGEECRRGIVYFKDHPYLKILGISTIVFGMTAGIVMFVYNQFVAAQVLPNLMGDLGGGRFMALQRALASAAQSLIFVLLMSQGKTGRGMLSQVLTKLFFLLLGVLGFLVSMLGVADFSRAVSTALMSPAAIASFSLIPALYRGRAMSLNNMVLSAIGIILASAVLFLGTLLNWGAPFYLGLILLLLICRIILNLFVNQGYLKALSRELQGKKGQAMSGDQLQKLLGDPVLLNQAMEQWSQSRESEQRMVWYRLKELAVSPEHWQNLQAWAPAKGSPYESVWVHICGNCAPQENLNYFKARAELKTSAGREAYHQWLKISKEDQVPEEISNSIGRGIDVLMENPQELQWLVEHFPSAILDELKAMDSVMTVEKEKNLLNLLSAVEEPQLAGFFLDRGTPELMQLLLPWLAKWKHWEPEKLQEFYYQEQDPGRKLSFLNFSYTQEDSKWAAWRRNLIKEMLRGFRRDSLEESTRHWFILVEQGILDSLHYLLRRSLGSRSLADSDLQQRARELKPIFLRLASSLQSLARGMHNTGLPKKYHGLSRRLFQEEFRRARDLTLLCMVLPQARAGNAQLLMDWMEQGNLDRSPTLLLELLDTLLPKADRKNLQRLMESQPKNSSQGYEEKTIECWKEAIQDKESLNGLLLGV